MAQETCITEVKDTTANPAPLGLLGFGMTTVLLNLHNTELYELGTMIFAMGIFYGGMCQVFAGLLEWKKGNTFGTTAFTSYGAFWILLAAMLMLPKTGAWAKPSEPAMISFFIVWGVFTGVMFIGTLKLNRALQVVFFTLTVLFFLLAIRDTFAFCDAKALEEATKAGETFIAPAWHKSFAHLVGYEGIFCGLSAIYTGLAQVLNEVYRKTVWPLGPVAK